MPDTLCEDEYRSIRSEWTEAQLSERVCLVKGNGGVLAYLCHQAIPVWLPGYEQEEQVVYTDRWNVPAIGLILPEWAWSLDGYRAYLGQMRDKVTFRQDNSLCLMLVQTTVCGSACHYCTPGDSPVEMANGRTLPISQVQVGDSTVGFSRKANTRWKFKSGTVTNVNSREAEVFEYTLSDGSRVKSTESHLWFSPYTYRDGGDFSRKDGRGYLQFINPVVGRNLVKSHFVPSVIDEAGTDFELGYFHGAMAGEDTAINTLCKGRRFLVKDRNFFVRVLGIAQKLHRSVETRMRIQGEPGKFLTVPLDLNRDLKKGEGYQFMLNSAEGPSVTMFDYSRASLNYVQGWLSGIIDAEGTFSGHVKICQNAGYNPEICACISECLTRINVAHSQYPDGIVITATEEIFKLWSNVRLQIPSKVYPAIAGKIVSSGARPLKVVRSRSLGLMQVYSLTTTTGTYINQGFLSSNCYAGAHTGDYEKVSFDLGTLAEFLKKHGNRFITAIVYGGDSLMTDGLAQVLRENLNHKANINFVSGLGYSPAVFERKAKEAAAQGVQFTLSIDPPPDGGAYTRVFKLYPDNWYQELLRRAGWLTSQGIKWGVRPSITNTGWNHRQLREDLARASGQSPRDISMNVEPAVGGYQPNDPTGIELLTKADALFDQDVTDIIEDRLRLDKNQHFRDAVMAIVNPDENFSPGGCYNFFNRVSLGPRGEISFCNEVPTYESPRRDLWTFGSHESINELQYAGILEKVYNRPDACKKCDHLHTCGTHCPIKLMNAETGGCMYSRVKAEKVLRLVANLAGHTINTALDYRLSRLLRWSRLEPLSVDDMKEHARWLMPV